MWSSVPRELDDQRARRDARDLRLGVDDVLHRPRVALRPGVARGVGRLHVEGVLGRRQAGVRLRRATGGVRRSVEAALDGDRARRRPVVGRAEGELAAVVSEVVAAGFWLMEMVGAVRSATVQVRLTVALTFSPSDRSVAWTVNVCWPRPRPVYWIPDWHTPRRCAVERALEGRRLVGREDEPRRLRVHGARRAAVDGDDRGGEVGDLPLELGGQEARVAGLDRLHLERVLPEREVLVASAATCRSATSCPWSHRSGGTRRCCRTGRS